MRSPSAASASARSRAARTTARTGTQAFDLPPVCRADIGVAPPSLSETLTPDTQASQNLTISNGGKEHGADLTWTITEAASDCSVPSDVPWLSAAPTAGTTAAADSSNVAVTFDSTGLAIGVYTAVLCVNSNDDTTPVVSVPVTLDINYAFAGFFGPVANAPALNPAQAGQVMPLIFSLGGDFGLNIFAAGYPASRPVNCTTLAPLGALVPTQTPGGSGLTYDAAADRYNYPWRTSVAWRNSCRELVLRTNDSTERSAFFRF